MEKKTNTQLLVEAQNIVDEINNKKEDVEKILTAIDLLEKKYYDIVEEIKKNGK